MCKNYNNCIISENNYYSMLVRADKVRNFLNKRFISRMWMKYLDQLKRYNATRHDSALEIDEADYQKLMVLASYGEKRNDSRY